ncbi:MAG: hypothetical protein PHC61_08035 [Chitinivibrionales bacterium]|nr:hypothetical protein [Chitinivibrionales bacterium]
MSLFEIKCPQCKATLFIDLATGKVVDHKSSDHQKADFNEFLKSREKGVAWDDKLNKVKNDQARRKAELEEKFKKAKEEGPVKPDEAMKSPFDWD